MKSAFLEARSKSWFVRSLPVTIDPAMVLWQKIWRGGGCEGTEYQALRTAKYRKPWYHKMPEIGCGKTVLDGQYQGHPIIGVVAARGRGDADTAVDASKLEKVPAGMHADYQIVDAREIAGNVASARSHGACEGMISADWGGVDDDVHRPGGD